MAERSQTICQPKTAHHPNVCISNKTVDESKIKTEEENPTDFTIGSLNVCGIKSKLDSEDFKEYILKHDIVVLNEMKTDDVDNQLVIEKFAEMGCEIVIKNRKHLSIYRSGGIGICYKKHLQNKVKYIETISKYVAWLDIDDSVIGKHLLLGAVYIPPEGTSFADGNCYYEIEKEMLDLFQNEEYSVILCGDFNSYTSTKPDYVEFDDYVNDDLDLDTDIKDMMNVVQDLEALGIAKDRTSLDKHRPNNFGNLMLEFCVTNNVVICNGRIGSDKCKGEITCVKGNSVIDYILCSPNILGNVVDFAINDYDPMLSDVHCALKLVFNNLSNVLGDQISICKK